MNLSSRGARGSLIRVLLSGLCLGAAGALAACSSGGTVGTGNAPQRLVISAPGQAAQLATLQMYQCLTSGLRALLYFTDGSVGDFTGRVVWSSSNPGAVQISNGDIAAPGGGFYPNGALVPAGPGNAVITAQYFSITAQTAISVGTPQSIKLKALINGDYVPLWRVNPNRSSDSGNFSMGQGTQVQLAVTAVLNSVETDITRFATLGFQVPNNAVATVNPVSSMLVAGTEGGPVVPMASFAPCSLTTITDPNNTEQLRVTRTQSIAMQPEFPPPNPNQPISDSNPLPQIIAGNSERFPVIAALANGDQQDVSNQSLLTVSGNSTAGAAFNGNLLVTTAAGGPLVLQATFNVGGAALTAPTISTSSASGVLQTFSVCWTDIFTRVQGNCPATQPVATVQAGTLTPLQFHAIGYYGTDSNNNPIYQEVTRNTAWVSSNAGIATFGSGNFLASQALGGSQGSVTVQVHNASAIYVPQVFTQLNVSPPP